MTPPPYKDEDVEDAGKEIEQDKKKKREFLEKMKMRKMELEREKEERKEKSTVEEAGIKTEECEEETGRTNQCAVEQNK